MAASFGRTRYCQAEEAGRRQPGARLPVRAPPERRRVGGQRAEVLGEAGLLAAVFEVAGMPVPWDSTHIVACCFGADPAVKPC